MANGCAGTPVRFCDVWQQDLFAQHAGAQAFWLGEFESTQAAKVGRIGAATIAMVSASESMIRFNIGYLLA